MQLAICLHAFIISVSKHYFITALNFAIKIYGKYIYHTRLNTFIITIFTVTFRILDENIEKLTNKMISEFNKVFIENYISNLVVSEFYSAQNVKLKIPNVFFDEMTIKVRK